MQSLACAPWNEAVRAAYGLASLEVTVSGCRVELFAKPGPFRLGYAATAPYLPEGGVSGGPPEGAPAELAGALFSELKRGPFSHLLVKSSYDLFPGDPSVWVDRSSYVALGLDLSPGAEALWSALDARTRNQTRKGYRANPQVTVGGAELLPDFYRVLSRCWRDHGTPMHSRRLFSALLEAFGSQARLALVYLGPTPVSAALLLVVGDTLHFPFAGTLKEHKPTCLNNVLYWSIIQWACSQGLRWFDMGRSPTGGGTARYKLSWGARPQPLYYSYFVRGERPQTVDSPLVRWAVRAWKHLPVAVANVLGPPLICRML